MQPESTWFSTSWVASYLALGKAQGQCAQTGFPVLPSPWSFSVNFILNGTKKDDKGNPQVIQTSLGK